VGLPLGRQEGPRRAASDNGPAARSTRRWGGIATRCPPSAAKSKSRRP